MSIHIHVQQTMTKGLGLLTPMKHANSLQLLMIDNGGEEVVLNSKTQALRKLPKCKTFFHVICKTHA